MFKKKLMQQEQGFTLIEVLVSVVMVTVFVAVTMQAMVIAAIFKAKAKRYSEATTWIQEDLENVKYEAAKLKTATLKVPAESTTTQLQVSWVTGFEVGDELTVGTDTISNVISSIDPSASTLTINLALGPVSQSNGVVVVATKQCNAISQNQGFAYSLKQNMPALSNNGTKTITGKTYTLARTSNVKDVAPYEVLELTYSITPQDGGVPLAKMYLEMIPNVAFRCQ